MDCEVFRMALAELCTFKPATGTDYAGDDIIGTRTREDCQRRVRLLSEDSGFSFSGSKESPFDSDSGTVR